MLLLAHMRKHIHMPPSTFFLVLDGFLFLSSSYASLKAQLI